MERKCNKRETRNSEERVTLKSTIPSSDIDLIGGLSPWCPLDMSAKVTSTIVVLPSLSWLALAMLLVTCAWIGGMLNCWMDEENLQWLLPTKRLKRRQWAGLFAHRIQLHTELAGFLYFVAFDSATITNVQQGCINILHSKAANCNNIFSKICELLFLCKQYVAHFQYDKANYWFD